MALISKAFKEPTIVEPSPARQQGAEIDPQSEGHESTRRSSLEVTLSELRHQETPRPNGSGKMPKMRQRRLTRTVP